MCRIAETLPADILEKMHAPPKPDYPILAPTDLVNFDAFLFGIPTRYGNFPSQWKVRSSLSYRFVVRDTASDHMPRVHVHVYDSPPCVLFPARRLPPATAVTRISYSGALGV